MAQPPAQRGVFMTLVRTLLFHIFSMLNGLLLIMLLAVTAGGLGLVLLCLFSASTRSSRLFVAWLWRNELRINSLVGEKQSESERQAQEQERGLRRESSQGTRGYERVPSSLPTTATPARQSSTRGREVTGAVMTFSILYFLLFKSLFNVIFATVPLLLWTVVAIQVVPSWAPEPGMVMADDTVSRVFVALATSFFAYQIGVAAASASVFVSEKTQGLIFHRDSTASVRAPLHETDSFRRDVYGTMPSAMSLTSEDFFMPDTQFGEELQSHARDRHSLPERSGGRGGSSAAPHAPPAPPQVPPPPPPPPFPHGPPAFGEFPLFPPIPEEARRRSQQAEESFRAEPVTRELDVCGIKIKFETNQEVDPSAGRGRGMGSFRGFSHRGGRGGRGSFIQRIEYDSQVPNDAYPRIPEPYARRVDDCDQVSTRPPPLVSPVLGRTCSDSPRGRRRGRTSGGRHRRSDSFDSGQPGGGRFAPDFDLKQGAHTRLWEALDLRPSAPGLPEEYPIARPAGPYSATPSGGGTHSSAVLGKSRSDYGRHSLYDNRETIDSSDASRKLEFFAAKQQLKEQSRQLKEAAKQLKREYKDQAKRVSQALKAQKVDANRIATDQERYAREQERYARDQERIALEQHRLAMERARDLQEQAANNHSRAVQRQRSLQTKAESQALRALDDQRKFKTGSDILDEDKQGTARSSELSASFLEREHEVKTRDHYAMSIEKAAEEEVERQQRELLTAAPDVKPFAVSQLLTNEPGSGRSGTLRGRRLTNSSDQLVQDRSSFRRDDARQMTADLAEARTINFAPQHQLGILSDREIEANYGSLSRTIDDSDVFGVGQYVPFTDSPVVIRAIDTGPRYRGAPNSGTDSGIGAEPAYDAFSPPPSPTSSFMSSSFIESEPVYNALSPTNTLHDADFPSEEFQQVYRSIRFVDDNRVVPSQASALPHFEDVPGQRDKVHFCSFAPPSVYPSKQSFRYAVWAFLPNQRQEMRERAEAADPEARQLSIDTKMILRRGALVHVTLEVPEGFKVLNGATQGFPWEGKVSSVNYDIECTEHVGFGQVQFRATIVVGTEVAVLRSYVIVSSRKLDPSELEVQLLDSNLEVLDKTFQEIPFRELEVKERVGSGYFGEAFLANYQGEDVVVKTIRADEFGETNDQILKEFQHEAAVLSMFGHHPCIVPFVGASTDTRYPLSLITKYLPFGSLEDNLKKPETRSQLSVRQRTLMLRDAAAGLLNIHEGGFIHRDVAARNCLVDQDLRVKICDFGLCRRVNSYGGSLMKDSVGPIKYMAPESLQPPHSFSYDSDSWMFGVLMWETFTATPPFQNKTPLEAGMSVLRGERLPMPENLPADLQLLMESCFHETPSQRPLMSEILTILDEFASPPAKAAPASLRSSNGARSSLAMGTGRPDLERRDRSIWV